MIVLENVTKTFPNAERPAVDGVNFQVEEGHICVLVGPSGCGKTTILRMINRLIEPDGGDIYVRGQRLQDDQVDPNQLRRQIGYVIQQIGLLPHRTIEQNVALVPKLLNWAEEDIRRRVEELLEMVGLDPDQVRDQYPLQLSGGMMQRVGVARALAADPPIMLMDEPFGAVDPIVRARLQDEFLRLQREMKKTICFVTHDINEAIKMGDQIVVLNEGRVVQVGTPMRILSHPADGFVQDLIGIEREIKLLELTRAEVLMTSKPSTSVAKKEVAVSVQAVEPAQRALELMMKHDTDIVGVHQHGELVGVISWDDIKKYIKNIRGDAP